MTLPPWLVLLLLLGLVLSLSYQLISRRFGARVIGYWIITSAGILLFEALAESLGWNITRVGDLRMLPDVTGGVLAVTVLWLLRI
jgi:hypothetical protein